MKSYLRWFLVIAWMALIFFLSSIAAEDLPIGPKVAPVIIHFLEFFILSLLLVWAINAGTLFEAHAGTLVSAFIVTVFYGLIDELHQLYVPGRVTDMVDWLVDTCGALTAIILILLVAASKRRRSVKAAE